MNKEINQICQRINCQDILNKKFYPVWFFTNERISSFFQKLENHREIKKVFSIGGGVISEPHPALIARLRRARERVF